MLQSRPFKLHTVDTHVTALPTPAHPSRQLLSDLPPRYLSRGRAANADVRLLELQGQRWVVKDFSACPWFIRNTLGRWMIGRELYALERLAGIPGIPQNAVRIDVYAFAYHFVEARPLAQVPASELSPAFFLAYEALVQQMHDRGLAHLDLRNSGNVLISPDFQPILIDFQSWLTLPRWWPGLARYLQKIDLSGVYKFWVRCLPGTIDAERQAVLDSVNNWRRGWVFSNYFGLRRFFRERS